MYPDATSLPTLSDVGTSAKADVLVAAEK